MIKRTDPKAFLSHFSPDGISTPEQYSFGSYMLHEIVGFGKLSDAMAKCVRAANLYDEARRILDTNGRGGDPKRADELWLVTNALEGDDKTLAMKIAAEMIKQQDDITAATASAKTAAVVAAMSEGREAIRNTEGGLGATNRAAQQAYATVSGLNGNDGGLVQKIRMAMNLQGTAVTTALSNIAVPNFGSRTSARHAAGTEPQQVAVDTGITR